MSSTAAVAAIAAGGQEVIYADWVSADARYDAYYLHPSDGDQASGGGGGSNAGASVFQQHDLCYGEQHPPAARPYQAQQLHQRHPSSSSSSSSSAAATTAASAYPSQSLAVQTMIKCESDTPESYSMGSGAAPSVCVLSGRGVQGVSQVDMDVNEMLKMERKRARNRIAASKCRMRKLEKIAVLDQQASRLRADNDELQKLVEELKADVYRLKQEIRWHVNNGCRFHKDHRPASGHDHHSTAPPSAFYASGDPLASPDSTTQPRNTLPVQGAEGGDDPPTDPTLLPIA